MSVDLLQAIEQEKQRRARGQGLSAQSIKENGEVDLIDAIQMEKQRRAQEQESAPFYQPALDVVSEVGETIDAYTGAPTRAAIEEVVQGRGVGDAFSRFGEQFGEDPSLAPTGKQLATQMGVSPDKELFGFMDDSLEVDEELRKRGFKIEESEPVISQAGAVGAAIDIFADPLNFIPFGTAYKGAKVGIKGALGASKTAAKGAAKLGKAKIVTPILKKSALADDIASGAKTVADVARGSGDKVKKMVDNLINPKIADDYEDFISIANNYDIPVNKLPDTVKYGKDSTIGNMAQFMAEQPGGDSIRLQFGAALADTSKKLDKTIDSIGKGANISSEQAGKILKNGYDKAVDDLFNQVDFTYDSVRKQVPGLRLTDDSMAKVNKKINGLTKKMKGVIKYGSTAEIAQAKEVLRRLNSVKNTKNNYKQFIESMQGIGKTAYSGKVNTDIKGVMLDKKSLKELYKVMSDAAIETTDTLLGSDIAKSLRNNNKKMTEFFSDTKNMRRILLDEKAPEKMYDSLFKRADSLEVERLRRVLDAETFNTLRTKYLGDLIKKHPEYNTTQFLDLMKKMKNDERIGYLFKEDEIKSISELARLGNRIGAPIFNPPKSGLVESYRNLKNTIKSAVENEAMLEALKKRATEAPIRAARKAERAARPASKPIEGALSKFLDSPKTRAGISGARAYSIDEKNQDNQSLSRILRGE